METLKMDVEFEDLRNEAQTIKENSKDYVLDPGDMRFDVEGGIPWLKFSSESEENEDPIKSFALGQLCEKLRIPARYINRCIEEDPDLASRNINTWLEKYEESFFVRTTYDKVKGVLSTKYSPYDSNLILDDVDTVLDQYSSILQDSIDGVHVSQAYLTPEELQLRLISNRPLDIDEEEKDELYPGVTILSSDVGKHGLSAKMFIYKKVCTNGLMVPINIISHGYSHIHMGVNSDDFRAGLLSVLKYLPAVAEDLESAVKATQSMDIPCDPYDDEFEGWLHKELTFSKDESSNIAEILRSGKYKTTRWGLINAVTEAAQKYNIDRRLEMETQAGTWMIAA